MTRWIVRTAGHEANSVYKPRTTTRKRQIAFALRNQTAALLDQLPRILYQLTARCPAIRRSRRSKHVLGVPFITFGERSRRVVFALFEDIACLIAMAVCIDGAAPQTFLQGIVLNWHWYLLDDTEQVKLASQFQLLIQFMLNRELNSWRSLQ